jgi:predicted  nucleic acid-binding Zn-ribbon protein
MSELEAQEDNKVTWTIDGEDYSPEDLSSESQVHFVRAVSLRNEIQEISNQIANAQARMQELQIALGFRENALRESIKVVEDEVEEVVN